MMFLVALLFSFHAHAEASTPVACAPQAQQAAWSAFVQHAGVSLDNAAAGAYVGELAVGEDGQSLLVDVDSNDSRNWDGYVRFQVAVTPACEVTSVKVESSEQY